MTSTTNPSVTSPEPKSNRNPFQLLKDFYAGAFDPSFDDDDVTIAAGSNASLIQTRLNLHVPGDEEESSRATQILTAMKEILECLKNEFPSIQIIP